MPRRFDLMYTNMKSNNTWLRGSLSLAVTLLVWEAAKHLHQSSRTLPRSPTTAVRASPTIRDLQEGLDLSHIVGKVQERQGWSGNYTTRVQEEYLRFLYLVGRGVNAIPSPAVDEVWHQHILTTSQYARDCERLFGRFVHHFPSYTKAERRALAAPRAAFVRTYTAVFGAPPADIWAYADAAPPRAEGCGSHCSPDGCDPGIVCSPFEAVGDGCGSHCSPDGCDPGSVCSPFEGVGDGCGSHCSPDGCDPGSVCSPFEVVA
jgi:hypothetical protein